MIIFGILGCIYLDLDADNHIYFVKGNSCRPENFHLDEMPSLERFPWSTAAYFDQDSAEIKDFLVVVILLFNDF